jgi:hypothetical protein
MADLGHQAFQKIRFQCASRRKKEIAVRAGLPAEWYMEINSAQLDMFSQGYQKASIKYCYIHPYSDLLSSFPHEKFTH